jgi:hypothetical protein
MLVQATRSTFTGNVFSGWPNSSFRILLGAPCPGIWRAQCHAERFAWRHSEVARATQFGSVAVCNLRSANKTIAEMKIRSSTCYDGDLEGKRAAWESGLSANLTCCLHRGWFIWWSVAFCFIQRWFFNCTCYFHRMLDIPIKYGWGNLKKGAC